MRRFSTLGAALIAAAGRLCGACGGETVAVGDAATDATAPDDSRSSETDIYDAANAIDGRAVEQLDATAIAADAKAADAGEEGVDTEMEVVDADVRALGAGSDAADAEGDATDATPKALGEQCTDVISEFCQQLPRCEVPIALAQCINGFMPDCCTGGACTTLSTVSDATVLSCKQMMDTLDCTTIVNTSSPAACLLIGLKDGASE